MGVRELTLAACDATWDTVHKGRSLTLQIGTAPTVLLKGTSGKTLQEIFLTYKTERSASPRNRSRWQLSDYEVYQYDESSLRVFVTKKKRSARTLP